MNTTAVKVVIDTNIIISMIGKKSPYRWLFDAIINGDLVLCISNEILLEYNEILEKKNGAEVAENVTNFLSVYPFVERYQIHFNFNLIPNDEDDNKFADCYIVAQAQYLVSNDKHFKVLKDVKFPEINIVTIDEFSEIYHS